MHRARTPLTEADLPRAIDKPRAAAAPAVSVLLQPASDDRRAGGSLWQLLQLPSLSEKSGGRCTPSLLQQQRIPPRPPQDAKQAAAAAADAPAGSADSTPAPDQAGAPQPLTPDSKPAANGHHTNGHHANGGPMSDAKHQSRGDQNGQLPVAAAVM